MPFSSTKIPSSLFYSFLALIFLFEGLGWRGGRDTTFVLILIMPLFLFSLNFILKNKIYIPKIPTILYGGFLYFSYISTIFSIDQSRSIPYLFFYISLYFIFLYVYNHHNELKKYLIPFIFIISFIFSVYSLVIHYLITINPSFFYPVDAGQYVFSRFGSHNNLGNFLIIPLLISAYNIMRKNRVPLFFLSCMYFLPFFVFSFSRTAYLSFSIGLLTLILYLIKQKKLHLDLIKTLFLGGFLLLLSILFFAVTVEFASIPLYEPLNENLVKNAGLKPKEFSASRPLYFSHALLSIQEKPLWGVGPNNYVEISKQYTPQFVNVTDSSHNFFLDTFSENGIIAGVFFLLFLIYVFKKGNRNIYFFLSVALLVNFQTMFTFKIYSFLLLFFIFFACTLQYERKT